MAILRGQYCAAIGHCVAPDASVSLRAGTLALMRGIDALVAALACQATALGNPNLRRDELFVRASGQPGSWLMALGALITTADHGLPEVNGESGVFAISAEPRAETLMPAFLRSQDRAFDAGEREL